MIKKGTGRRQRIARGDASGMGDNTPSNAHAVATDLSLASLVQNCRTAALYEEMKTTECILARSEHYTVSHEYEVLLLDCPPELSFICSSLRNKFVNPPPCQTLLVRVSLE